MSTFATVPSSRYLALRPSPCERSFAIASTRPGRERRRLRAAAPRPPSSSSSRRPRRAAAAGNVVRCRDRREAHEALPAGRSKSSRTVAPDERDPRLGVGRRESPHVARVLQPHRAVRPRRQDGAAPRVRRAPARRCRSFQLDREAVARQRVADPARQRRLWTTANFGWSSRLPTAARARSRGAGCQRIHARRASRESTSPEPRPSDVTPRRRRRADLGRAPVATSIRSAPGW